MKRKRLQRAFGVAALCLAMLLFCGCGEKKDAAAYVEQGMEALEKGDFSGAEAALSEAERLLPEDPRVLRAQGIAAYEEERYGDALGYFERALSALGESGELSVREDILCYKADAELKSGDYEAADADYSLLIASDNEYAEYYLLRGRGRAELGNTDGAVEDFRAALSLAPGNLDYCEDMYLTLAKQGASQAGEEFLNEILSAGRKEGEESGRYARACLELSRSQMENGQYEEALPLIQEGILAAGEPERKLLLYEEAVCYEQMRNWEEALEKLLDFQEAYGADEKIAHEIAFLKTRTERTETAVEVG